MSAATARSLLRAEPAEPTQASTRARRVVLGLFVLVGALGVVLLAASLVPSATLAARLLGAAGEARAGSNTQELAASLDTRLRFSAAAVLALLSGLVVTRSAFEEMLAGLARGIVRPRVSASVLTLASVAVVTLGAVLVRLPFLSQPMRYDEALTFNEFASRPLYYGLSFYPDPNNHLFNTLLMHLAFVTLGNQPWVLRLPALLAGVLLVPATYAVASLLFGSGAAFLTAVLVGVSSYIVEYSTNARGYTLQALCFVVLLALIIVAARRDSPTALLLGAFVAALGAWAVPTMLYGVVIAGVWLVLELRRSQPRRIRAGHLVASGFVLGLAVTLLYLPVSIVSGADKLVTNRFVVPLEGTELASELPHLLASTWTFWTRDVPLVGVALLVAGFVVASASDVRQKRIPLGVLAFGICLGMVIAQRVAPFERVWLFLLPLFFAVAAGGLARFVDGRWLGITFGAVLGYLSLTSGSILTSAETGVFPDAEAVTQTLAPRLAPDDAVMTTVPASLPELQYYFPRSGLPIELLVRSPDDAQNLWLLAPPGVAPDFAGWPTRLEIQRYSTATLFELKRAQAAR